MVILMYQECFSITVSMVIVLSVVPYASPSTQFPTHISISTRGNLLLTPQHTLHSFNDLRVHILGCSHDALVL